MTDIAEIFSNTWAIILVLLFFGGSIFVHELGHFLAAKMRGLKVIKFSIGFGPAIFSRKGKDGCEYLVGALPLGGYVAIPQLADLSALEGTDSSEGKNLPKASCTDKVIVSAAGSPHKRLGSDNRRRIRLKDSHWRRREIGGLAGAQGRTAPGR